MLSRKLYAAFLTAFLCYFIVPFFFHDYSNSYFYIGLGVSIVTVPILFIIGVLTSVAIEKLSKHQQLLFSYSKHIGVGFICVIIFSIITGWGMDAFLLYTSIMLLYVTIFFVIDHIILYFDS